MIETYASFFETLSPKFKEGAFEAVFDPDALFADPFQRVHGVQSIINVFRHMYASLENPRFEIIESIGDAEKGYIRWRFHYNDTSFEGVSHVRFGRDGKVLSHIDYWDAASNVYEKLPVLGSVLRWLKRKLSA